MSTTVEAQNLADQIENARTSRGMTIRDLSDTSGIPYPTLRRKLQNGPDLFNVREVSALASALDAKLTIGFAA